MGAQCCPLPCPVSAAGEAAEVWRGNNQLEWEQESGHSSAPILPPYSSIVTPFFAFLCLSFSICECLPYRLVEEIQWDHTLEGLLLLRCLRSHHKVSES